MDFSNLVTYFSHAQEPSRQPHPLNAEKKFKPLETFLGEHLCLPRKIYYLTKKYFHTFFLGCVAECHQSWHLNQILSGGHSSLCGGMLCSYPKEEAWQAPKVRTEAWLWVIRRGIWSFGIMTLQLYQSNISSTWGTRIELSGSICKGLEMNSSTAERINLLTLFTHSWLHPSIHSKWIYWASVVYQPHVRCYRYSPTQGIRYSYLHIIPRQWKIQRTK